MRVTKRWLAVVATAVWSALVLTGACVLYAYETREGARADAPSQWPSASGLPAPGSRPAVIMFVHPECPCTRASLSELAAIAGLDRAALTIVFSDHGDALWTQARHIPNVRLVRDDGTEARRFGAATSGHVVVYDRDRALRYSGGITGSRGHAGDNAGRRRVEALLADQPGSFEHAVFGCPLAEQSR